MASGLATDGTLENGEHEVTLDVRNDLTELERIGRTIAALGRRCGWPNGVAEDLERAVDEVVTNIISYAYDDDGEHRIEIRIAAGRGAVQVEVADDGRRFDPTQAPEAVVAGDLSERPIGGLGWHLVRTSVDSLAYRRDGERNVVTMTKQTGQAETA
jgi:anti-sigma regulatory factor (Ser/Thr protein kinase)